MTWKLELLIDDVKEAERLFDTEAELLTFTGYTLPCCTAMSLIGWDTDHGGGAWKWSQTTYGVVVKVEGTEV